MFGRWNMTIPDATALAAEITEAYTRSGDSFVKVEVKTDPDMMAKLDVTVTLAGTPVHFELRDKASKAVVMQMIRAVQTAFIDGVNRGHAQAVANMCNGIRDLAGEPYRG